jgi:hypothetical protein
MRLRNLFFLAGAGGGAFLISIAGQQKTVRVVAAPPCKGGLASYPPWERDWTSANLPAGSVVTAQGRVILPATSPFIKMVGGFVLAIFGSFVGAWLGYEFGKLRDKRAVKFKAAIDFSDAVLSALSGIYPLDSAWPDDVNHYFRAVFPQMQMAVSRFRPFIPPKRRPEFDAAWNRYRLGDEGREIDVQLYQDYMAFGNNPNAKQKLYDNVAALLKFSEIAN